MTMPNFLLIGAAKSGTSSLYNYMIQHPQVYGSEKKEPSFFAFEGKRPAFTGPGDDIFNRSVVTDIDEYRSLFNDVQNENAIGEGSIIYLYSPEAPARIKGYIPDVRLIAILRNPVDRAYSAFANQRRDGREPEQSFERALEMEKERISMGWQHLWHYKNAGMYGKQLDRYLKIFPRRHILVITYEDFLRDPPKIMREIFRHLNVDDSFRPDMSLRYNVSGMPRSKALHNFLKDESTLKSMVKPMLSARFRFALRHRVTAINVRKTDRVSEASSVYPHLIEDYRADIAHLKRLVGRSFRSWLRPMHHQETD